MLMLSAHVKTLRLVVGCVVIVCAYFIIIQYQRSQKNTSYRDGQNVLKKMYGRRCSTTKTLIAKTTTRTKGCWHCSGGITWGVRCTIWF